MKSHASRRARFIALFCVIASSFVLSSPSHGQASATSRAASVLDSMPHARRIDQVALSPDGTEVAYIENGELAVLALSGGASHAISVEGKLPLREVAWSADGKQLAFLADLPGDGPSAQLWTVPIDGRDPVKRAELKGYAENPRFSPDGSKLA